MQAEFWCLLADGGLRLSGALIAGLFVGVVVSVAVCCWLVGCLIDCAVHFYTYCCVCISKSDSDQVNLLSVKRQVPPPLCSFQAVIVVLFAGIDRVHKDVQEIGTKITMLRHT